MRSARPTTSPACGPPTSLSPLNVTMSAPDGQPLGRRRLVGQAEGRGLEQGAAAQIVDDDGAVGMCDPGELGRVGRLHETRLREVRRVDAQHDRCPALGQGRFEVGRPRPVRRADLDQARAGPPDDLGDPDPAADLDQLAARHGHPAPTGEAHRQGKGRGVVDGDQSVLGTGQRDQVFLGGPEAGSPVAGGAIEFEERVTGRGARRGLDGSRRPGCATQVRMQDDAGRVDDRGQVSTPACGECVEPGHDRLGELVGFRGRAGRPRGASVHRRARHGRPP